MAGRPILVADLFCGAGGSSSGAKRALAELGLEVTLACVNHWPVAIETHKRNHPEARHYCMDLEAAKPAEIVPEGRLDLLMASPTCTHHSRARGGRPTSDQQRMDPWHVVRWCTALRVDRLLVENVPEYVEWGPVDLETGRPVKARKGEYFNAWVAALRAVGFTQMEWGIVNCADHGDATTRKRFFLLGRSDGRPVRWPKATHAPRAKAAALGLKPWRPAREIIDWSVEGQSIFTRKKALAPATLARIAAGMVKFGWPAPFLVVLRRHCDALGLESPLPAITAQGTHLGLVTPGLPFVLAQGGGGAPREAGEPLPTIVGGGAISVIYPDASPFVAPYYGGGSGKTGKSVDEPLDTVTAKARFGLAEPFVTSCTHHGLPRIYDVGNPLPTVTGARRGEFALVEAKAEPFVVGCGGRAAQSHPTPAVEGGGAIETDPRVVEVDGQPVLFDVRFRMLRKHELARAMSFSDAETEYEFVGNQEQAIKQIGNAVPVRTSAALVRAMFADMGARAEAAE